MCTAATAETIPVKLLLWCGPCTDSGAYTSSNKLPKCQSPQTVPPCAAPQVSSVVTEPVAVEVGVLLVGAESDGSPRGAVDEDAMDDPPPVQPDWQPLEIKQYSLVLPQ